MPDTRRPPPRPAAAPHASEESFARGLARAYGGAIIFSLPLMMTMEMWSLGSAMEPLRLGLLTLLLVPMLVGLSHVAGFEPTFEWRDDLLDALVRTRSASAPPPCCSRSFP